MSRPLIAVILAAGHSSRMGSKVSKVLHPLAGKPLIFYPLDLVESLGLNEIYIVVGGPHETTVRNALKGRRVQFVKQDEPKGTGDAVNRVSTVIGEREVDILVIPGDAPLLTYETARSFIEFHSEKMSIATVMTAEMPDPTGYGRIIRSSGDRILMIIEEVDAFPEEKEIKEVNAGIYIFRSKQLFRWLQDITPDNEKGEYYLTDVIGILQRRVGGVYAYKIGDWQEILGVNTRWDLAKANEILQKRLIRKWMEKGVTFVCPDKVYVEMNVIIGKDTIVYPFVSLLGETVIGEDVVIGSGAVLKDAKVSDGARIPGGTFISGEFAKRSG
jgi:bifunctional UDP-N-acetylglucosamine pyrophosphorylase/glucosamine-1-phosphate N-acetyltransferase